MSIMLTKTSTLKSFLGLSSATTVSDALLEQVIQGVSARIEAFLDRGLVQEERTKQFDVSNGGRMFFLPAYPILADSVVTVTNYGSLQTVNSDYWVHETQGYIEFLIAPSYVAPAQMSVTWIGGYTPTYIAGASGTVTYLNVPEDIDYACLMQSAFLYTKRDRLGVISISAPDGSTTTTVVAPDLLPEVKRILSMHRNRPGI